MPISKSLFSPFSVNKSCEKKKKNVNWHVGETFPKSTVKRKKNYPRKIILLFVFNFEART